jgi:hypothetical protein
VVTAPDVAASRTEDPDNVIDLRVTAAKAAIGYEKPRLTAVDSKVEGMLTLEELIHMSYEAVTP